MTIAKAITKTLDISVEDVRIDLTATIRSYDLTDTQFIFEIKSSNGMTVNLTGSTAMYIVEYVHNSQTYAIQGDITVVNSTKISFNLPEDLKGYSGTVLIGIYVKLTDGTKIDIKDIAVRIEPSIMDKDIDFSAKTYFQDFETVKAEVVLEGEKAKTSINEVVSDVQTTGDTVKADIKATLPRIETQISELKEELADLGNKKVLRTSLKCDYNEDVPIDNIKADFVYTLGDLARIYRDTVEITLNIYSNGGEGYIYFWRHDSTYGQILVFKNKYTFTRGVNTIIIPILEDYFDDNPNETLDFLSIAIQCVTEGAFTSQSGSIYLYTNGDPFTWYSPISDFQINVGDFVIAPNYWEGNVTRNKTYPCIDVYMKSYIEKRKTGIITVAQDGTGDYTTINDAVRNAGDIGNPTTILIREGVYDEVVYLRNKHEISLKGVNRDRCVIKNTTGQYYATPVMVNGDFTIENLTLRMEENGFYPEYTDNVFATYPGYALHIDGNSKDISKQTIGRIVNCTLYSEAFPAVGIGINQNQKVIFENCEMIRNCTKNYFKRDNWKGALVCHSSNYATAPNQKFAMKDCVLRSNYGYSGNIRGELGDSSQFEVTAVNNTCYSDEIGLNSFEYTKGQSRLNSISHGNTSSVLNAGN